MIYLKKEGGLFILTVNQVQEICESLDDAFLSIYHEKENEQN